MKKASASAGTGISESEGTPLVSSATASAAAHKDHHHGASIFESVREVSSFAFNRFRNEPQPSVRSVKRHRLNIILCSLLSVCLLLLAVSGVIVMYRRWIAPARRHEAMEADIKAHALAAAKRAEKCRGIDWETACDSLTGEAGARRRATESKMKSNHFEEAFLIDSDDPTVTYDEFCLRVYRLNLFGNITFPYHSSQLLRAGGNFSMALFIQHGALRNSENYFCSFKKLMMQQNYRDFDDILVIAPDFNYGHDLLVHPLDAFWNSSKPWGDWRVGAESDPKCCGETGRTVSSFDVLDHMLAMLANKRLYPKMNKISFVGHSAGAQMIQRYAVISDMAALFDIDTDIDVEFVIANPSSYTYLDNRRFKYHCGNCTCNRRECSCDQECTKPPYSQAQLYRPSKSHPWPCYSWNYNRWPYGIGMFTSKKGNDVPYILRDGPLGVERAVRLYRKLHVVYLVGQNDTCNDNLPVCDASCWKRKNSSLDVGEWPCFRNQMDTRCPAMLQGPCRRTRGHQYMRYLEDLYGEPTHTLHTIPGVGHNASAMFGSAIGLKELFDYS